MNEKVTIKFHLWKILSLKHKDTTSYLLIDLTTPKMNITMISVNKMIPSYTITRKKTKVLLGVLILANKKISRQKFHTRA